MASDVKVQAAGLHTSNNPFSAAPPGAMARADNCVLNAQNVLEPRRGFEGTTYNYGFGGGSDRANVLTWFGSTLLVQYASKLAQDTGVAFTDYSGTYAVVSSTLGRMRFATAAGNLYFNCSDGQRVLDSLAGTPAKAGVPRALKLVATPNSSNGWQTPNTAVAYRVVWGIVDANGNVKLGVPSGRYVAQNYLPVPIGAMTRTGGTTVTVTANTPLHPVQQLAAGNSVTLTPGEANFAAGAKVITGVPVLSTFTYAEVGANVSNTVAQEFQITRSQDLTLTIPSDVTTSHFYRVYRSEMSATADTAPSDELYLVYEGQPNNTDISNGYVAISDITPEAFLGDAAPWDANEGYGLVNTNERPPVSLDLAFWDSRVWYANCTQRHRLFLDVLGVGSPAGIQNNDTITIAGTVLTFKSAPAAATDVTLTSAYTAAVNIEVTAKDLIDVINSQISTVRAYYVSGENDNPGRILLEEKAIGGSAFTVTASRKTSFNPALPRTSDNNARANGLLFSKPGEPEAVPVVNEVLVGSRNDRILRVMPLRNALIVFKEREGIWTVTGSNGRYDAEKIGVARLLANEAVCVFSDKVWCFTDQGETTVTEGSGVSVVSYNIDSDLVAITLLEQVNFYRYCFGVAQEGQRRVLAWFPHYDYSTSGLSSTEPVQCYVYQSATKAFCRWTKQVNCAAVNPTNGLLTIGRADTNRVAVERASGTFLDYADETFAATISSVSGATVTMNTTAHGIEVGAVLESGGFSNGVAYPPFVTAVNGAALTMSSSSGLPGAGAITVWPAYPVDARWQPVTGGNPSLGKMTRRVTFLFNGCTAAAPSGVFNSEALTTESTVALTVQPSTLLGADSAVRTLPVSPLPPDAAQAAQLTVGFSVREALTQFKLHGFVVDYEPDTEKSGRR